MAEGQPVTILCISSYFKGNDFLRGAKGAGATVILLTEERLADSPWAHDSIDEFLTTPDLENREWVINTVSYLARARQFDAIIPLDEYDVAMAAVLREHLAIPGAGVSESRRFRDKLAMRIAAAEVGIPVPDFVPVVNYDRLRAYMDRVPAPWLLKPRTEAGAMGIKRINTPDELWGWLDMLGDRQSYFLLEQYVPGDVYHVDSLVWDGEVIFASAQKYGVPPMNVAHEGGVFVSRTLPPSTAEGAALTDFNETVLKKLGMRRGVTHAEFIRAHVGGQWYFLEVAIRVGGAHIADLIEQTAGLNPWAEWGRMVVADARGEPYQLPPVRRMHGALLVCLARQEYPDMGVYNDPEVVWRLDKKQHAGLILQSDDGERIDTLVEQYIGRFSHDFLAWAPAPDRPTE
jgi:biotin carboxylase